MTLAQQLEALCQEHGMDCLSIQVGMRDGKASHFTSYAHDTGLCASGSAGTPHEAITEAIVGLNAKRAKLVDVPELEEAA